MKPRLLTATLGLLLTLAAAGPAFGDDTPVGFARLTSLDGLQKRLDDPNLRLLDLRPKADFDKGHIPGAVWVDTKAVEARAAKPETLNDAGAWAPWLASLGIGPDTELVAYDADRQLAPARLWWILSYLGVEKIGLLDGNYPLWVKQNRPVSDKAPAIEPRAFRVMFRPERSATRADLLSALNAQAATVIDARTVDEYLGTKALSKRGGHVPGACHLEWNTLVDKDGRFLDEPALRARLAAAGVSGKEPVITHCQGGGRASVDAFVFERLGFKTRNYYPGWSEWGNRDDSPVESSQPKK